MSDHKELLSWRNGQLYFQTSKDATPIKAKALFARPISGWGEEVSILHQEDKSELMWIPLISQLEHHSQEALRGALHARYGIFEITRITEAEVNFGHRIIKVETKQGPRTMNLVDSWKNILHQKDGSVIIRDAVGNRFRIPDPNALDSYSQTLFRRAL